MIRRQKKGTKKKKFLKNLRHGKIQLQKARIGKKIKSAQMKTAAKKLADLEERIETTGLKDVPDEFQLAKWAEIDEEVSEGEVVDSEEEDEDEGDIEDEEELKDMDPKKKLRKIKRQLSDPEVSSSEKVEILKKLAPIVAHCAKYPRIRRSLFRALLELWVTKQSGKLTQDLNVEAFLCIYEMALTNKRPKPYYDAILKHCHARYLQACTYNNEKHRPNVLFLQNCLLQLMALDEVAAYQLGFSVHGKLARAVKLALSSDVDPAEKDSKKTRKQKKKDELFYSVYGWQFVHCAELWAKAITRLAKIEDSEMRYLAYPHIEIMLCVIRLRPTLTWFPLRLKITQYLINIATTVKMFVPVAPHLLAVMQADELLKPLPSKKKKKAEKVDYRYILRASTDQVRTKEFQRTMFSTAIKQLIEYFEAYNCTIGYPELALPSIVALKRIGKYTKIKDICFQTRDVWKKLEARSKELERLREAEDFGPSDLSAVALFEQKLARESKKSKKLGKRKQPPK